MPSNLKRFSSAEASSSNELDADAGTPEQRTGAKRRKRIVHAGRRLTSPEPLRRQSSMASTGSNDERSWELTAYDVEIVIQLDGFPRALSGFNGRYLVRRDQCAHGRETYWKMASDGGAEGSAADTPLLFWCSSDSKHGKKERWVLSTSALYPRITQESRCKGVAFFHEGDITKTPLKVEKVSVGGSGGIARHWVLDTEANWVKKINVGHGEGLVRAAAQGRSQGPCGGSAA